MAALDPQAHIAMLERELQWAHLKIQVLEGRLRQRRVQMLGPQSETLSDLQLELLAEEEPSATREEVEAEARREPLPQKPARERRPHPGRRSLPESLPRVEQVVRCAETNCQRCGAETAIIGYDESEVLDDAHHVPGEGRRINRDLLAVIADRGGAHNRLGSRIIQGVFQFRREAGHAETHIERVDARLGGKKTARMMSEVYPVRSAVNALRQDIRRGEELPLPISNRLSRPG